MRPPERRLALLACAAVIALSGTACTSSTPDAAGSSTSTGGLSGSVIDTSGASSSEAESQTRSVTSSLAIPTPSVIDVPTPTPSSPASSPSSDPAAQEAADRAAVEAAWDHFWEVVFQIVKTPETDRLSLLSTVAADPILSQLLTEARDSSAKSLDRYGVMVAHPYWDEEIAGKPTAIMGDCQDSSGSGVTNTLTGERTTVGVSNNNLRAVLNKGADGNWRVVEIFYLIDVEC